MRNVLRMKNYFILTYCFTHVTRETYMYMKAEIHREISKSVDNLKSLIENPTFPVMGSPQSKLTYRYEL